MNLNQIAVIGDCHALRLIKYNYLNTNDVRLTIWSKSGLRFNHKFGFDPNHLFINDAISDEIKFSMLDNSNYNTNSAIKFSKIENKGIIIFWLGYVDIKDFVFVNSEKDYYEILNSSILNIKKYFNNSKIMFIEPIPQFNSFAPNKVQLKSELDYSLRVKQNDLFIKILKKVCKENNIEILISQNEIIECMGKKKITKEDAINDKVGGLLPEYCKKIYDLLISKLS